MGLTRNQAPIAIALAGFLLLAASTEALRAAPGVVLEPHRAVYDLSLESRDTSASVSSVRGRMVHEFTGNSCDGYSVSMRWVAQMGGTDGDVDIDDVRFASFEDAGGEAYTYTSTRLLNERVVEEVTAHATRGESTDAGRVNLTKPEDSDFALPIGTIFPVTHLKGVIGAAIAGQTIAEEIVYDVSEDGKHVYNTLAVVGASRKAASAFDVKVVPTAARLKDLQSWRVTISYFKGEEKGEETPAFEQTFDLLENGVATNLILNYGEIVIRGTLKDLEFLDASGCEGAAPPG